MFSRIVRNAIYIVCLLGAYVAFHILHKIVAEELYDRLLAEDAPKPLLDAPGLDKPDPLEGIGTLAFENGYQAGYNAAKLLMGVKP